MATGASDLSSEAHGAKEEATKDLLPGSTVKGREQILRFAQDDSGSMRIY